jgi:drug/metabolite transporter (DMT)-like permease
MATIGPQVWLALLFLSSLGEVYFPDIMKLNHMPSRTNWMFLAHAIGNACVGLLGSDVFKLSGSTIRMAAGPAIFDMASYAMLFAGVAMAGAQTKSILYSSSILWSAVLSKFLLGKVLSTNQWLSIMLLFVGLLVKSLGGSAASSSLSSTTFLIGASLVLVGCFIHAFVNVMNERIVRGGSVTPKALSCIIGLYTLAAWIGLYSMGYALPEHSNEGWVYTSDSFLWSSLWKSDAVEGLPMNSGTAWIAFVIMTTLHACAFYSLLGSVGVVSSGIVKGMTTSTYVMISGLAFCSIESHYCLSPKTLLSSAICVSSVICYSLATASARAAAAKLEEPVSTKDATEVPSTTMESKVVMKQMYRSASIASMDAAMGG